MTSPVGHAEHWDKAKIVGSLARRDCAVTYRLRGQKLAVAEVHMDLEGLREEVEFERIILSASLGGGTTKSAMSPARQAQAAIGGSR